MSVGLRGMKQYQQVYEIHTFFFLYHITKFLDNCNFGLSWLNTENYFYYQVCGRQGRFLTFWKYQTVKLFDFKKSI